MTASTPAVNDLIARVAERWRAVDPLLPAPAVPPAGCGTEFAIAGPDGIPAAMGVCHHWRGAPESLEMSWGAAVRFQLAVWIGGPDVAGQLDRLLARWRDHLAGVPGSAEEDTAVVVNWPSRDIAGVAALLRRGFAPMMVLAARLTGRHPAESARPPEGRFRIRRAGPGDLDTVVRLALELIRYDAHFGGLVKRPSTAGALHRRTAERLAGSAAWAWLAERDGAPVGMLVAEGPVTAARIAPLVNHAPVAYLQMMYVDPEERGAGAGTALTANLHHEVHAAGVGVTLLYYAQVNPLSAPFWGGQGYRPLWTTWEARPASAIR